MCMSVPASSGGGAAGSCEVGREEGMGVREGRVLLPCGLVLAALVSVLCGLLRTALGPSWSCGCWEGEAKGVLEAAARPAPACAGAVLSGCMGAGVIPGRVVAWLVLWLPRVE